MSHKIAIKSKTEFLTYDDFDRLVDDLCKTLPDGPVIFTATPTISSIVHLHAAWRRGRAAFPVNARVPKKPNFILGHEGIATYLETSSVTPKIACHSLENHLSSAFAALEALDLKSDDAYALNLPLHHVSGIAICVRTFLARATLLLPDSIEEATHISMVPTQLYRFIKEKNPLRRLKCLLVGGAPLHKDMLPRDLPIKMSYGMTETSSMVVLDGKPLPHCQIELASDGEILVKGPSIFQGYLGQGSPLVDGFFHTKDIGRFDEEGKLEIVGRKDRQFISGGENIHPEEIERALLKFPAILQAKVEPKDNEEFGQVPHAKIVCEKPLLPESIQTELRKTLPSYKVPKSYEFVDHLKSAKVALEEA